MTTKLDPNYKNKLESILGGRLEQSQCLSDQNNLVFEVSYDGKMYIAKFYTTKGLHGDNEVLVNGVMPPEGKRYLRPVIYHEESPEDIGVPFAVFKKVEGTTLLELIKGGKLTPDELNSVAQQIVNYMENSFAVNTDRFGYLEGSLVGTHDTWMDFLFEYQIPTSRSLFHHEEARHLSALPFQLISRDYSNLDTEERVLVPIDMNLSNFMIDNQGKLKVIDPGSILSGPREAGYGEFTAHCFGTPLYKKVMDLVDPTDEEMARIRTYAALNNLNVLAFIARNGGSNLNQVKPWGNPVTFFELIDSHVKRY